jgi:hypothetical protein
LVSSFFDLLSHFTRTHFSLRFTPPPCHRKCGTPLLVWSLPDLISLISDTRSWPQLLPTLATVLSTSLSWTPPFVTPP